MGRKKIITIWMLFVIGLLGLVGCNSPSSSSSDHGNSELIYKDSMELSYAKHFKVDYYEGGYTLLTVKDGTKLLVVPEDGTLPEDLEGDVQVIQQPVDHIYLVAAAVMDMFDQLDAMDAIRFTGKKEQDWYIEGAKEAMMKGDLCYAGKYNKPDYERLVSENCRLTIENTMITHAPEVVEMMQDFDIPVIIEYSSYEDHPLGRMEWIRFFGALLGKEEEADAIFEEQKNILKSLSSSENTEKTVAFFFVTSNGLIQVRQSSDYVPKMIELAGGRYIFENLSEGENGRSTMNMQVEEFYRGAKDADYLIYNSAIDGGIDSIEALIDKCSVLKDFKAVKEGNVWCTTNDLYQQTMSAGHLIQDIHGMLHESSEGMNYLFQLQ